MDAPEFRAIANRCRELMRIAVRDEVREQLRQWAEDFDAEADDLELVPGVQGTPRLTNLTVHPGLVWNVGHDFGVGIRAAFDVNSPQWGFTPLVNHSWPITNSFFKAYFVEAVLPVRFSRPTNGPSTTPVTFGLHFGLGF